MARNSKPMMQMTDAELVEVLYDGVGKHIGNSTNTIATLLARIAVALEKIAAKN